jgi:acyl-coenzyme A thioesterase PaaI-like protein
VAPELEAPEEPPDPDEEPELDVAPDVDPPLAAPLEAPPSSAPLLVPFELLPHARSAQPAAVIKAIDVRCSVRGMGVPPWRNHYRAKGRRGLPRSARRPWTRFPYFTGSLARWLAGSLTRLPRLAGLRARPYTPLVNRLIDFVQSAVRIPVVGPRLVAGAVSWVAPYFASISPQITLLQPGRCDVRVRNRRAVRNHIGTVHAIAMCNMCELAAGMAIEATLPPGLRWIPRGMTVRYLKKAETDLEAAATISASTSFVGDVVVPVQVRDARGETVMEADITMYVSPKH